MPEPGTLPFAVVGATGQQGGAVVDALLAAGQPVRALVRDPTSVRSRALAAREVTLAHADQDDTDSMVAALTGVTALFLMTTFAGPEGTAGEIEHGRATADAAVRAGVPRVVYSSVGGAERSSGVPHFESKRRIEEHLAEVIPASFVRPTFFMENLAPTFGGSGDSDGEFVLRLPMSRAVPLQLIAVRDIGVVSAALLLDPTVIDGDAIEIAGDVLTPDQIADRVGAHLGRAGRFEALPLEALGQDEDRRAMFGWFVDTPAYQADLARTRAVDPTVLDLSTWLEQPR
jgi:uncharacterized protein YbjT (DUF2867 family)